MPLTPVTLTGKLVQLEPLQEKHLPHLLAAAADGRLWELFYTTVPSPEKFDAWFATAKETEKNGIALPFAVRSLQSGEIIGTTRYCNVEAKNRRLEIGYTWYSASVQRTGINTECKSLLLKHAFENLHCIAVEFRTDWLNHRSQRAIERLGAKRDGVLRNHVIMSDGRIRDTVVYSITQNEWPGVKQHLQFLQSKYPS